MRMIKRFIWIIPVAALVALGVRTLKHKREADTRIPPAKTYAVTVEALRPQPQNVTLTLPFVAQVGNDRDVALSTRVSARLLTCKPEGSKVRKGEVVATLDERDLQAKAEALRHEIAATKRQMEAAQTSLKTLLASHARSEKLMKVNGISRETFEAEEAKIAEARSRVAEISAKRQSLEASLTAVTQQRDYTLLRAPVEGIVSKTYLNPGDMTLPGKPLMRIRSAKGDYLLVRLPMNVKPLALRYEQKSYPLTPLKGTQNGLLRYRTPVLGLGLAADSFVNVDIVTYRGKGLLLPPDALLRQGGRTRAFVIENVQAHPTEVRILAKGVEGYLVDAPDLIGRPVAVAKPDVLLKLTTGLSVRTQKDE
ncbi:MAG: hypothetical protein GXO33_03090 [Epsilonproteobacteria bacterium]|nr:hypothetical protein [Campylobacterota bacterium]